MDQRTYKTSARRNAAIRMLRKRYSHVMAVGTLAVKFGNEPERECWVHPDKRDPKPIIIVQAPAFICFGLFKGG